MTVLTTEEFWHVAPQWGSYIRDGDPGACMYCFGPSAGFQSVEHALDVLKWVTQHCPEALKANESDPNYEGDIEKDRQELIDMQHTAIAYILNVLSGRKEYPDAEKWRTFEGAAYILRKVITCYMPPCDWPSIRRNICNETG